MKTLFVLLLAAIAISLAISQVAYSQADLEDWNKFKIDFGRTYDETEDARRLRIFKENKDRIEAHNAKFAKGEVSYQMGINDFADRLPEELPRGLRTS